MKPMEIGARVTVVRCERDSARVGQSGTVVAMPDEQAYLYKDNSWLDVLRWVQLDNTRPGIPPFCYYPHEIKAL